jgi:hypothetical protein
MNELLNNIKADDPDLNNFIYCLNLFESVPNRIISHNEISLSDFESVVNLYNENTKLTEYIFDEYGVVKNDKIFLKINDNVFISYVVLDGNGEEPTLVDFIIFYKEENDLDTIKSLFELLTGTEEGLEQLETNDNDDKNNLNIIGLKGGVLDIQEIDKSEVDKKIELFYNKETFKSINRLSKSLSKGDKGISVLYGDKGVGKTNILKYLSDKIERTFILIPLNLIEHTINNPEFVELVKTYQNPILIIDDCEAVLSNVYNMTSNTTYNIIQMVDGLYSDELGISFLLIFNVDSESEIDDNILDSNNLIDVVEFSLLSEKEANKLSSYLESEKSEKNNFKKKTKLIEVIKKRNIDDFDSPIGF